MAKKPVRQVILKDLSEVERNKIINMTSAITKIALQNHQVIAVFITMDVKGDWQIVHFGAGPEIDKRAKFMADSIAVEVPRIVESYEIPQMDITTEKVDA